MTARAVRAKASGALTGDESRPPTPACYFGTGEVAKKNDGFYTNRPRLRLELISSFYLQAENQVLFQTKPSEFSNCPLPMGRKPHQLIWQWNCSWFQGERAWPVQSNSAGL